MNKIHIVDLIGIHCGMHYYDSALVEILRNKDFEVDILSNFKDRNAKKKFFPMIFGRNKFVSAILLFYSYWKLLLYVCFHRKDTYIYMAYGEFFDLICLTTSFFAKNFFADVHEVHALKYKDESKISNLFNNFYKKISLMVIYHSERTKDIFLSIGLPSDRMLYVPHFKYSFKKEYELQNLSPDIAKSCSSNKIKFLFFGNLSIVKGIDTVIDVFNKLPDDLAERVELVIAGKNVDNIDFSDLKQKKYNYYLFDRHINDDELVYLYSKTDFILLPYKKSSQSGIFAMACYFKKPMLLTDIPYFKSMITEFPSFGRVCSLNKYDSLVRDFILSPNYSGFYTEDDCEKFSESDKIDDFVMKFTKHIKVKRS